MWDNQNDLFMLLCLFFSLHLMISSSIHFPVNDIITFLFGLGKAWLYVYTVSSLSTICWLVLQFCCSE